MTIADRELPIVEPARPSRRCSAFRRSHSEVRLQAGTTLLELVIVMAIIAVLSAIAIPRFAGALQNSVLDDAAQRVAADLRLAQSHAVKTQREQPVMIDVAANTYELVDMPHPDRPTRAYSVTLDQPPYQSVRIESVDLGGPDSLAFDRFGSVPMPVTIVLEARNRRKTIRISPGASRISIE